MPGVIWNHTEVITIKIIINLTEEEVRQLAELTDNSINNDADSDDFDIGVTWSIKELIKNSYER